MTLDEHSNGFVFDECGNRVDEIDSLYVERFNVFVCEKRNDSTEVESGENVTFPTPENRTLPFPSVVCPILGHVTHTFLACDVWARCFVGDSDVITDTWGRPSFASCPAVGLTSLPPMMTCDVGSQHVPYTLVCDHRKDCQDGSDEDFCVFHPCNRSTEIDCGQGEV